MGAYKFEYKDEFFWLEMIGVWALSALQFFRLFVGRKGNKQERSGLMGLFIMLLFICQFGLVYFLFYQSYVIQFEFVYGMLIIAVEVLQLFLSIYASIEFC